MKSRTAYSSEDKLKVFNDEYYQLAHFRILCDCGSRLARVYRDRTFEISKQYGIASKSQLPRKYALQACPFILDLIKEN